MAYDRETVIVDRGGGSGAGVIVGIIVALALLGIVYLVFFANGAPTGSTVAVDVPAVSVNVAPNGQ